MRHGYELRSLDFPVQYDRLLRVVRVSGWPGPSTRSRSASSSSKSAAAPAGSPASPRHFPGVQVEHDAAVELAFLGGMLGDVGEPQLVGGGGGEPALDQVLAGGGVLEVLDALPGSGQAADAQRAHDLLDQLGVHDQPLLDLQGG